MNVSTVTATPVPAITTSRSKSHFLIRRLHSLTGVLFGGYICLHLLINATLIEGSRYDGVPTVFQQQVDKIHSLPFLGAIAFTLILLPIIYHTIYGIYITITGQPNVANYPYTKNWLYTMQRVTAVILVLFIAFHYLGFKGFFGGELGARLTFVPVDDPATPYSEATQSTINHLRSTWWVTFIVYPIGVLAATFHLSNGFWAAGVTWGLTVTKKAQQRWGALCIGLFLFTTACGFTALAAGIRGQPVAMESQLTQEPRVLEKAPTPPPDQP